MTDITKGTGTTGYPAALDTRSTLVDGTDTKEARNINGVAAAVVAIETELGLDPRGTAASVMSRINTFLTGAGIARRTGPAWNTTFGDGDIWVGSAASNSMELSRLNAGQGLTLTRGAHSFTLAMTSLAGTTVATQAQMEAATDIVDTVTAGRVQYHPGVAKFWITFYGQTAQTGASHNVSSLTDLGVGNFRITYTTAFSTASHSVVVTPTFRLDDNSALTWGLQRAAGKSAASCNVRFAQDLSGTLSDPSEASVVGYGDQ